MPVLYTAKGISKDDFKRFLDRIHKAHSDAGLPWSVTEGLLDGEPDGSLIEAWFYEWMQE